MWKKYGHVLLLNICFIAINNIFGLISDTLAASSVHNNPRQTAVIADENQGHGFNIKAL